MKLDRDVEEALRILRESSLRKDRQADQLLRERDTAQEWADKLAEAISVYFGEDIGEHSNLNNPWVVALDVVEAAMARRREVGKASRLRESKDTG